MSDNFLKVKKGISFKGYTMPTNPVDGDVYFDTIQGFLGYSNGSWGPLGGSGVINYDTNPSIGSTVGYNLYSNTPGPVPVNGTGGTAADLTFVSTQTNPIIGHTMGVLTKDGNNAQGQGLSYDFQIDPAFSPGLIAVSFSYQASANFTLSNGTPGSNSDIEVFAYDITNNILIPVIPYQLTAGIIAPATFTGAFQASANSLNYRIIWHVATTNTNAWTFNMANVIITPQATKNFNTSPVSIVGQIISVASENVPAGTLECNGAAVSRITYYNLFQSIGTAFGVGDGSTTFNLPDLRGYFQRGWDHGAGHDPDSASRSAINGGNSGDNVGSYQADQNLSHNHEVLEGTASIAVGFTAAFSINNSSYYNNQVTYSGGNQANPRNINVMYCIVYDSAVVLSQLGGTQVPVECHVSTAANGLTSAAPVIFDVVNSDNYGGYNPTTGIWTCPVSGIYLISAQLCQNNSNNSNVAMDIYLNGSSIAHSELNTNGAGTSALFMSSQVTSSSAPISSTSFSTASNSPALTFTPTITGTYRVSCGIPLLVTNHEDVYSARVFNTTGGATLLAESQGFMATQPGGTSQQGSNGTAVSLYTLTAGVSYQFDIQVKSNTGSPVTVDGADAPFYMFAEGIGLNSLNAAVPSTLHVTLTAGDEISVQNTSTANSTSVIGGTSGNFLDIVQLLAPPNVSGADGTPVGVIQNFAGALSKLPQNYVVCDGSSQLISDYPALALTFYDDSTGLYAWGSADALHFNLPPSGVFLRGVDVANAYDPDSGSRSAVNTNGNSGNTVGSYQVDQYASHSHGVHPTYTDIVNSIRNIGAGMTPQTTGNPTSGYNTQAAGGNQTNPRNVYVYFIVKYQ